jgi:hypothetical protein
MIYFSLGVNRGSFQIALRYLATPRSRRAWFISICGAFRYARKFSSLQAQLSSVCTYSRPPAALSQPDRNGDCKFFVPVKTGFAQIIANFSQQTQNKLSMG